MNFNKRQSLEGKNRASELEVFLNWQGQSFYFNWSLTVKTKSCYMSKWIINEYKQMMWKLWLNIWLIANRVNGNIYAKDIPQWQILMWSLTPSMTCKLAYKFSPSQLPHYVMLLGDGDEGLHEQWVQTRTRQLPVTLQEPGESRHQEVVVWGAGCFIQRQKHWWEEGSISTTID